MARERRRMTHRGDERYERIYITAREMWERETRERRENNQREEYQREETEEDREIALAILNDSVQARKRRESDDCEMRTLLSIEGTNEGGSTI